jgi:hypothetical protein
MAEANIRQVSYNTPITKKLTIINSHVDKRQVQKKVQKKGKKKNVKKVEYSNWVNGYDLENKTYGTYRFMPNEHVWEIMEDHERCDGLFVLSHGVEIVDDGIVIYDNYCLVHKRSHNVKLTMADELVICIECDGDCSQNSCKIDLIEGSFIIKNLNNSCEYNKNGYICSGIAATFKHSELTPVQFEHLHDLPIKHSWLTEYSEILNDMKFKQNYIDLKRLLSEQGTMCSIPLLPAICSICKDKTPNMMMVACNHLVYCADCNISQSHGCPICRKYSTTTRVYF